MMELEAIQCFRDLQASVTETDCRVHSWWKERMQTAGHISLQDSKETKIKLIKLVFLADSSKLP